MCIPRIVLLWVLRLLPHGEGRRSSVRRRIRPIPSGSAGKSIRTKPRCAKNAVLSFLFAKTKTMSAWLWETKALFVTALPHSHTVRKRLETPTMFTSRKTTKFPLLNPTG